MSKEKKRSIGKMIASLFGLKSALTSTAYNTELNKKNSDRFNPGNIANRYACRSTQSKRRKLERRRGRN